MSDQPLKLNDYQRQPELTSTRDGFGRGLVDTAKADDRVVGLCADLTESVRFQWFKEAFPERFIEVGIAEQNLMGLAAGLALAGRVPFAGSYAAFSPCRNFDQLRVSVCYSNLNVKAVGGHAGLTVGPDGATHQALEDIAITRALPNLTVIVPCDDRQAYRATLTMAQEKGPMYLRLSREKTPRLTGPHTPFELGRGQLFRAGGDVTLVGTGIMTVAALRAADELAKLSISARVINIHTIKPIDQQLITQAARETGALVTAEEHQLHGGLGGAVAEVLAERWPVPLERVAVQDTFGESGPAQELLKKYGLTSQDIVKAAQKVIKRKNSKSEV
ncbi:MAG: transketolase [Candidatus Pacebacteria bacterium CG10_big_fil_rev_8_21_14_0_10_56_10]|nr:MAG: transketolase [Candidatus Pacebacteria bacterium CG10_big_fil_rev_8_21_14_0_10_56_10]